MRGSGPEDGQHSTPDSDARPRPWLRVIASLALFGFLVGLMIGRMLQPEPLWLKQVEVLDGGLALWFNVEPEVQVAQVAGAVILRARTLGREREGQLRLQGRVVNWHLRRERREMELRLVAARPLRAEWHAEELGGRWRLMLSLDYE